MVRTSADWRDIRHRIEAAAALGVLRGVQHLPYARRIPLFGRFFARTIAPLIGYRGRIDRNLRLIYPGMPASDRRRIARDVLDNLGRGFAETFAGADFVAHVRKTPISGEGVAVLNRARQDGRPAVIVTGHIGNFYAPMIALRQQGFLTGVLYRPASNRHFNAAYVEMLQMHGHVLFPRNRAGISGMVSHLRQGGVLGIALDQRIDGAPKLDFMGQPARTALSAAELALKFDAPLMPGYGLRAADGLGFHATLEAPVLPAGPEAMTQALNDSLSAMVHAHKGQWMWTHNRWRD